MQLNHKDFLNFNSSIKKNINTFKRNKLTKPTHRAKILLARDSWSIGSVLTKCLLSLAGESSKH